MRLTRRSLMMIAAIVLCAAMAIGGTFAYLTDTTAAVENVMTVGNVKIEQSENFEENSPLYPTDDDSKKTTKEVFVKNTGGSPAYVRTLVSFDMGTMSQADFEKYVRYSYTEDDWTKGTPYIENGKYVVPFIYKNPLAAGDTTSASLTKVWLDASAGNEQLNALATDGKYTITVLSQAVQTDGFDNAAAALNAAFSDTTPGAGDSDTPSVTRPTPTIIVSNTDELMTAIKGNEHNVIGLKAGTYVIPNNSIGSDRDVTLVGVEESAILDETGLGNEFYGGNIAFYDLTVKFPLTSHKGFTHTKSVEYVGCNFEGTQTLYATTKFTDCTFDITGDNYAVWTYGCNVNLNNCMFNTDGKAILVYHENTVDNDIDLTNCTFNSTGSASTTKAAVEVGSDNTTSKYDITFVSCTANNFASNNSTSPLWGNKNSLSTELLNVVIDGTDVY